MAIQAKRTNKLSYRFLRLMGWIISVWMLGITIVIVMSIVKGQKATQQYHVELYESQLSVLVPYQQDKFLGIDAKEWVESWGNRVEQWLLGHDDIHVIIENLLKSKQQWLFNNPSYVKGFNWVLAVIVPFLQTSLLVTQLILTRLAILVLAIPMFLLFGLVGMADGLMQRDLRKFGGGRESTFLFHRAKSWVVWLPTMGSFLYLTLPLAISPTFFLLPFAVIFGYMISVTMRTFKKYVYV